MLSKVFSKRIVFKVSPNREYPGMGVLNSSIPRQLKRSVIQCHLGRKAFCSLTFFLDHLHGFSQICFRRVQPYRVG